jgi:hypothetical protein
VKGFVFFLTFSLFFLSLSPVFASPTNFSQEEKEMLALDGHESISPGSLLYPVKRLGEKIKLSLLKNRETKAEYVALLLSRRFKEMVYLDEQEKSGFLVESANRFNATAGQIKSDFYPPEEKLKAQLPSYLSALEKLRDKSPANTANWLTFQQCLDTIRQLE